MLFKTQQQLVAAVEAFEVCSTVKERKHPTLLGHLRTHVHQAARSGAQATRSFTLYRAPEREAAHTKNLALLERACFEEIELKVCKRTTDDVQNIVEHTSLVVRRRMA